MGPKLLETSEQNEKNGITAQAWYGTKYSNPEMYCGLNRQK